MVIAVIALLAGLSVATSAAPERATPAGVRARPPSGFVVYTRRSARPGARSGRDFDWSVARADTGASRAVRITGGAALAGPRDAVSDLTLDSSGVRLAFLIERGRDRGTEVRVLDMHSGRMWRHPLLSRKVPGVEGFRLAWCPSLPLLACTVRCSSRDRMLVYDAGSGRVRAPFPDRSPGPWAWWGKGQSLIVYDRRADAVELCRHADGRRRARWRVPSRAGAPTGIYPSPDGRQALLWTSGDPWLLQLGRPARAAFHAYGDLADGGLAWSPGGRRIAADLYTTYYGRAGSERVPMIDEHWIGVRPPSGRASARMVLDWSQPVPSTPPAYALVAWSSDGRWLIIARTHLAPGGQPGVRDYIAELWAYSARTPERARLLALGRGVTSIDWHER